MAKTTTIHLRWLRFKRQIRPNGPRAAQRRSLPWMALPTFSEHAAAAMTDSTAVEAYR